MLMYIHSTVHTVAQEAQFDYTSCAGLIAGCPTTVVPFFGDQPFWGAACCRMGVGPKPIPIDKLDTPSLVEALQFMMRPEVQEAARTTGKGIEQVRRHAVRRHAVLSYAMHQHAVWRVVRRHAVVCNAVVCHPVLCYAVRRHAVWRHAVVCHAVRRHAVLCYAV